MRAFWTGNKCRWIIPKVLCPEKTVLFLALELNHSQTNPVFFLTFCMVHATHVRRLVAATFIAGSLFGSIATGIGATVLGSSVFSDVERNSYYDEAIGEMYSAGVIKGYDGTSRFGPDDYVTRGQVAVLLQRFKDEYGDSIASSSSSRRSTSSTSNSQSSQSSTAVINNPKGSFRFTTTAYNVNETVSTATISVVRVGGNDGTVSVKYATTAGTATAGTDFEMISETLTFGNTETSKTFTVKIKDDSSGEGNETITLTLSDPQSGASLTTPTTATLTILDNEQSSSSSSSAGSTQSSTSSSNPNGTLGFSAITYGVNENEGLATVRVNRTGGTNGTVAVNYSTSNGTATAGNQYIATNGTLTFNSGETSKAFTVIVSNDNDANGSKTFTVTLTSPTGGANLATSPTATVTINDDENDSVVWGSGAFKFAKSEYDITEGNGKTEVIVQRTSGASGTVSVNYSTTPGSAISGQDYTTTTGTLTFLPGETSKVITVPVVKDSTNEADETFFIDLSGQTSPATLISPISTTITIFD